MGARGVPAFPASRLAPSLAPCAGNIFRPQPSREARRPGLAAELLQGQSGMNGQGAGEPGSQARPLGVALHTRERGAVEAAPVAGS